MYRKSKKTIVQNEFKKPPIPENVYYVKNDIAHDLITKGTKKFHEFLETQNREELLCSVNFYKQAMQITNGNDHAFLNRKYASVIIRDPEQRDKNYLEAKKCLQMACKEYKEFLGLHPEPKEKALIQEKSVITVELQRGLTLLGNIALHLRDGVLLETTVSELSEWLEYSPNPNFKAEAETYRYHTLLSKGDIINAGEVVKQNLTCGTEYRHLAKVKLLELQFVNPEERATFFKNEILDNFWKSFDEHKRQKPGNCKNKALLKDFSLLFYIKTVQKMYGIQIATEWNTSRETIFEYMERQIKRVQIYRSSFLSDNICKLAETIKNDGKINLAFKLFANEPPNIPVPVEQFNLLFSDLESFKNKVKFNPSFFQKKEIAKQSAPEDKGNDSIHASVLKR